MTVRMSSDVQRTINRYDTKENWEKYNPVLLKGEIVVEENQTSVKMKCGNGIDKYMDLKYISF